MQPAGEALAGVILSTMSPVEKFPAAVYHERLLAYARRLLDDAQEAEDVVQETMLKATQAKLRDPRALRGWLYAVCHRQALDRLRARQRETHTLSRLPQAAFPADVAVRREEARRVRQALACLREPYRSALRLRYLEGLGFAEIARRLDTLERTARTWVGRGLQQLRLELAGGGA